jgi:site-specific DNA recombinase
MSTLRFAPLIRVSTERQEKQGESLNTQKKQLESAIESLGGTVYKWYEGQEHGTPDYERRILEQLMRDAEAGKFDAVMVCDVSRWSRDNGKSKDYLNVFRKKGIKFYIITMEIDLFKPELNFILGMGVEVGEFFASQQRYKSILSRIERAKQGKLSACGRVPYGRIYNKETGEWTLDEAKAKKIREIAKQYLKGGSFRELGRQFGINTQYLWEIFNRRCGDTWYQHFKDDRFNIDERIPIKVPPLLPDSIIEKIKAKCQERKVWDRNSPNKYQYLFAHIIYDEETCYTLSGMMSRGNQHYRPWGKVKARYMINAKVIQKAVLDALFEALGNNKILKNAVYDGHPLGKVAEELQDRKADCEKQLRNVDIKMAGIGNTITNYEGDDFDRFCMSFKPRIAQLEKAAKELEAEIQSIDEKLFSLPTVEEINSKREWMKAQLTERIKESYFASGNAFDDLPFEDKRKLILLIFGGKDANGKRYGIYVKPLNFGRPKKYKFTAYGRLGNVHGWVEGITGQYSSEADDEVFFNEDADTNLKIADLMKDANPALYQSVTKHKASKVIKSGTDSSCF